MTLVLEMKNQFVAVNQNSFLSRFHTVTVVAALFNCLFISISGAAVQYSLTELVDPLNPSKPTEGVDINDAGIVLAESWPNGWFLWEDGKATYTERQSSQYPLKINNKGQVTGYRGTASTSDGWLWTDGNYQRLEELPGGQYWNLPHALNDSGEVYGYSNAGSDNSGLSVFNSAHAVKWNSNGTLEELGVDIEGFQGFRAFDANNSGVVVGKASDYSSEIPNITRRDRAWVWKNGETTLLPTPGQGERELSEATSINNRGQISGWYSDTLTSHASVWSDGEINLLSQLPNGTGGYANDINDLGYVVGIAWESRVRTAALWAPDRSVIKLSDLVVDAETWILEEANAINNRGEIVGLGTNPQGVLRGFLLTPIPEPSAFVLLLTGVMSLKLASALRLQRRKKHTF